MGWHAQRLCDGCGSLLVWCVTTRFADSGRATRLTFLREKLLVGSVWPWYGIAKGTECALMPPARHSGLITFFRWPRSWMARLGEGIQTEQANMRGRASTSSASHDRGDHSSFRTWAHSS